MEDIKLVNDRLLTPTSSITLPPAGTITAVSSNKTREEAIRYTEHTFLDTLPPISATDEQNWKKRGTLLVKANVTSIRKDMPITQEKANYVRSLPGKITNYVGNLFCIIGANYMITTNVDVANGVANGAITTLRDIILKTNTTISVTKLDENQIFHYAMASDIECLILEHTFGSCDNSIIYPTVPPGHFLIKQEHKNMNILFNENGARIKVKMVQFPITHAIVLTGHKTQGMTMDNIILGSMSDKDQYGNTGCLYVVLSRVRDICGLYTLTPLSTDLSKYKKRNDVLKEIHRLQNIEDDTLKKFINITH